MAYVAIGLCAHQEPLEVDSDGSGTQLRLPSVQEGNTFSHRTIHMPIVVREFKRRDDFIHYMTTMAASLWDEMAAQGG